MLVKGPNLSKRVSQSKTDKVTGYIRKKNFLTKEFVPIFKISSKKAEIFTKRNKKLVKTNRFLFFASRIKKIEENIILSKNVIFK